MTRRWPNTSHWQRIEFVYRAIAGARWRTVAAADLGVERSNLRSMYDREMSAADIKRLDRALAESLGRHIINLDAEIDHAVNIRREVERGDYQRSDRYATIETPIDVGAPLSIEECLENHPFAAFLRPLLEGVE